MGRKRIRLSRFAARASHGQNATQGNGSRSFPRPVRGNTDSNAAWKRPELRVAGTNRQGLWDRVRKTHATRGSASDRHGPRTVSVCLASEHWHSSFPTRAQHSFEPYPYRRMRFHAGGALVV